MKLTYLFLGIGVLFGLRGFSCPQLAKMGGGLKPPTKIEGENFVFTGALKMPRHEAEDKVKAAGGGVGSSVTGKTTVLVAGPGAGSKLAKAKKMGVPVLSEEQFMKLLAKQGGEKAPKAKAEKPAKDAVMPKSINSTEQWKALPKEFQDQIIQQAGESYGKFPGVERQEIELSSWDLKHKDPNVQKLLKAMKDQVGEQPEADGEGTAVVGPPSATVTVLRLKDGTFIGGGISLFQAGAHKEDGGEYYFPTAKAAEKAGYDTGADVSWQTNGIYDAKLNAVKEPDYWDWTGW